MKIALINAFPNQPNTAEREFIKRFHIACNAIDVDCATVTTSDDILSVHPDLVLATHEFSRKLTHFPTIGLIWSPLSFFARDPYRQKSILSYDGFLSGSGAASIYLNDLQVGLGISKPVGEEIFLPTTYKMPSLVRNQSTPTLCYIGVHWDGHRHKQLFDRLAETQLITFYGPEDSWKHYPSCYGGRLPFDGRAVQETIASHKIALCLHKPDHFKANTPSMRMFESLAAGANVICDRIPFAVEHLSDFAYFLDTNCRPNEIADQITELVSYIQCHPNESAARAEEGKRWFDAKWSLESKIKDSILPLLTQVRQVGCFDSVKVAPNRAKYSARLLYKLFNIPEVVKPVIEVVIRAGGRPLDYLARASASVKMASSVSLPVGIVLVDYSGRKDIEAFAVTNSTHECPIRYVRSPSTGFRSTALWDGLRAVKAPFVAHLDDDDTVFPNHYRNLYQTLINFPHAKASYSGIIKIEDEAGHYCEAPNFNGPLETLIMERRELKFLEDFDLRRVANFDNFIQSNAWMSRTDYIQSLLGSDPKLLVSEDVYLYLLMASHGPFVFTGGATAAWHWRSSSGENSMLSVDQAQWRDAGVRVIQRLKHVPFVGSSTFEQISKAAVDYYEETPTDGDLLPEFALGESVCGGGDIAAKLFLRRFHAPEPEGVWSRVKIAEFDANLASDARIQGGALTIEFTAALGESDANIIEVEIEGGASARVEVHQWAETHRLVVPVHPGISGYMRVLVKASEICQGTANTFDKRDLAVYLQAVELAA